MQGIGPRLLMVCSQDEVFGLEVRYKGPALRGLEVQGLGVRVQCFGFEA